MRASTLVSLLLLTLLALTIARPTNTPRSRSSKHKLKSRQFEEELVAGADETLELFDAPRVHDSSEKIHEGTQQNNVTTTRILAAIRESRARQSRQRTQRLPLATTSQGEYSYDLQRSGVGLYSQQDGTGNSRMDGYAEESRQSGFGRYRVGDSYT
ncbi:uncharacterized protein SRS1_13434 [Sporisorium reilianum f. sp. reilianum]|uniref:Uncharacterized protein n=1 Tax=Sporisorium reilianum f. sp. reilianum TaxID=72559 RepID=A0A2N8UCC0_9BASI|nr:uncharacterized protein SRS1_13434 [Sporisorium reilianum f. sp. reilianum]